MAGADVIEVKVADGHSHEPAAISFLI